VLPAYERGTPDLGETPASPVERTRKLQKRSFTFSKELYGKENKGSLYSLLCSLWDLVHEELEHNSGEGKEEGKERTRGELSSPLYGCRTPKLTFL